MGCFELLRTADRETFAVLAQSFASPAVSCTAFVLLRTRARGHEKGRADEIGQDVEHERSQVSPRASEHDTSRSHRSAAPVERDPRGQVNTRRVAVLTW